ncbi:hypothetical protein ACWEGQ_34185 [Streptomyces seoulensis]
MTTTKSRAVGDVREPPPPRPRTGRNLLVGALLIVLSLASALASYVVFTGWLPSDRALYREYRAAGKCPARQTVPKAEDCLRQMTFTVENTSLNVKRLTATLRGPEPFPRTLVHFGDSGPVLSDLHRGDRVTGTVWRGLVVAIAEGTTRQNSSDAPRDEPQPVAAVGTFAGLLAAWALVFGTMHLVRPHEPSPFTWRPYGRRLVVAAGAACAAVGLITVWTGLPWPLVPTLCGAAVAVTAGTMRSQRVSRSRGK